MALGKNHLHMIGLCISMYRYGHQDKFPPDLQVLAKDGYLESPKFFLDPSDKAPRYAAARAISTATITPARYQRTSGPTSYSHTRVKVSIRMGASWSTPT